MKLKQSFLLTLLLCFTSAVTALQNEVIGAATDPESQNESFGKFNALENQEDNDVELITKKLHDIWSSYFFGQKEEQQQAVSALKDLAHEDLQSVEKIIKLQIMLASSAFCPQETADDIGTVLLMNNSDFHLKNTLATSSLDKFFTEASKRVCKEFIEKAHAGDVAGALDTTAMKPSTFAVALSTLIKTQQQPTDDASQAAHDLASIQKTGDQASVTQNLAQAMQK